MSATITNTGTRTGSDVVQLYLGDPAQAGEPPRQLKDFQKVSLAPGRSTTVRFSLGGHDLSYWDDTANGWVEPDGGYQVYVGDSAALANLPLHGSFTVSQTVGAVPESAQGSTATLTAQLSSQGRPFSREKILMQTTASVAVQGVGDSLNALHVFAMGIGG